MDSFDTFGLVGTTIAEKYSVEAVADAGGTAVVYRAFHRLWQRPVALKVFRAPPEIDDATRAALFERFVQEGRLLAELSERSTAVLQARDIGTLTTADGAWVPYMVLEWLEGATLEAVLAREAASGLAERTLEQAVQLLDPIAQALGLAHRHGIVHRDVKPSNVFVVGDPRAEEVTVKLLDFGIAKVVEDVRAAGAFGRTGEFTAFSPAYGAPEQFSRDIGTTGPWTDVFALALVLLEIVSGSAPLPGESIAELGAAATRQSLRPSLARSGTTRSAVVEAVFARAVTVEPSRRYASVEAFWADLRRVLAESVSSPVASTTHPRSTAERVEEITQVAMTPRSPRARWLVSAGVALAVGGVAMSGAWALMGKRGPPRSMPVVVSSPAPAAPVVAEPPRCPESMVLVPASSFFMGSDERDVEERERPAHKVRLDAYCIDRTEVTAEAYAACAARGGCAGEWTTNAWADIAKAERAAFDPLCTAREPSRLGKHPANCVSWGQARDYCAAADARLPTEAEWEHAARGTDGRRYPWGDAEPTANRLNACGAECVAWGKKHATELIGMSKEDDGWPTTAPVGSFPLGASPYGALDMTGNVWEWVADRDGKYEAAESHAPQGPATGDERVIRGGAWNGAESSWVRPTYRFSAGPAMRSHGIGFRCARELR